MTTEEAIEYLFDLKTDAVYRILPVEKEAIDMAIEALENNDKLAEDLQNCLEMYKKKKAEVEALKQNQWIPCEERLPEILKNVLISHKGHYGETDEMTVALAYRDTDEDDEGCGYFWWDANDSDNYHPDDVYAWMPLPKPYERGTE